MLEGGVIWEETSVRHYGLQNASVISADLPTQSQAASKSEFNDEFSDIHQIDVDVTDKNSVSKMIASILEKYGRIDTLIYSVTAKPHDFYAPFIECSLEGWQSVIRTELGWAFS